MGKRAFMFLFLLLFLLIPIRIHAAVCTDNELNNLKELAKKVEIGYEFDDEENFFRVYLNNVFKNIYVEDYYGNSYIYLNSSKLYLDTSLGNEKFTYSLYADAKTNCEGSKLATFKIEVPVYNIYYNHEKCAENKTLDICKKWYDNSDLTEAQFLKKLDEELKVQELSISKDNVFTKILNVIFTYKLYIVVPVLIGVVIVFIVVRNKKRVKIDL